MMHLKSSIGTRRVSMGKHGKAGKRCFRFGAGSEDASRTPGPPGLDEPKERLTYLEQLRTELLHLSEKSACEEKRQGWTGPDSLHRQNVFPANPPVRPHSNNTCKQHDILITR